MTTYAIGSVNGCYQSLLNLLEKIQFDPKQDNLWFAGNLIHRGPESLAILRICQRPGQKCRYGAGRSGITFIEVG